MVKYFSIHFVVNNTTLLHEEGLNQKYFMTNHLSVIIVVDENRQHGKLRTVRPKVGPIDNTRAKCSSSPEVFSKERMVWIGGECASYEMPTYLSCGIKSWRSSMHVWSLCEARRRKGVLDKGNRAQRSPWRCFRLQNLVTRERECVFSLRGDGVSQ